MSTAGRPIMLFAADENITLDMQLVYLFKGEHKQTAYLADKAGSHAYPADAK